MNRAPRPDRDAPRRDASGRDESRPYVGFVQPTISTVSCPCARRWGRIQPCSRLCPVGAQFIAPHDPAAMNHGGMNQGAMNRAPRPDRDAPRRDASGRDESRPYVGFFQPTISTVSCPCARRWGRTQPFSRLCPVGAQFIAPHDPTAMNHGGMHQGAMHQGAMNRAPTWGFVQPIMFTMSCPCTRRWGRIQPCSRLCPVGAQFIAPYDPAAMNHGATIRAR
jgi:ferredoxin